jgi:plasmid maintenance system antidote protein VapI
MAPVHPEESLLEDFLQPLAVSQYQLAKRYGDALDGIRPLTAAS